MQNLRNVLRVLLAVAVAAGLFGAGKRFVAESHNRAVEITLDMAELQKLAAAEGKTIPAVLHAFKEAGATSVAVTEDTLANLEETRRMEVVSTASASTSYMMIHQGNFPRVVDALQHRTHLGSCLSLPKALEQKSRPMDMGIDVHYPYNLIRNLGIGLDPAVVEEVKAAHLRVVGRVSNNPNTPEPGIDWTLKQLHEQGVSTIIFSGDEILGYDGLIPVTAHVLQEREMNYGAVEFGKIKGDDKLYRLVPDRTIRVHTVTGAEMASATPPDNIQRFSLAARERNIRMLYVRLFLDKTNPLAENLRFVEKLNQTLKRSGLDLSAAAHPYEALDTPLWLRAVIGLGIGSGFLLLMDRICGLLRGAPSRATRIALAVALALALLPCLPVGPHQHLPVRLAALVSAIVFPALALLEPHLLSPLGWDERLRPTLLRRLGAIVLMTTVGIALQVGLLADRDFLVKADAFLGIKAALYLPLLLVTLVWGLDLRTREPGAWLPAVRQQAQRARALLDDPIRIWQVVAGIAVLAVLALLWLRSGNEGTAVVSGAELKFRDLLDRYLVVRPRFKALLFASLILGLYLALRGNRRWALPFFLLGTIAVTDFLNTFCHLHTPLLVSTIRDLIGLALGASIGGVLVVVLERRRRAAQKDTA